MFLVIPFFPKLYFSLFSTRKMLAGADDHRIFRNENHLVTTEKLSLSVLSLDGVGSQNVFEHLYS